MYIDIRDAFFDEIYNIGLQDKNVILISADTDAFSIRRYKKELPSQFINIGCAEQNMTSVAAGLALSGKYVFICAIIPFITMRCYEHIKVNICSMNLPITIIGTGAGFSFENDGPTHHAVVDIAIMKTLPELTIFNPSDPMVASQVAKIAYTIKRPVYIRIDKGKQFSLKRNDTDFINGFSILKEGTDVCIITTGTMCHDIIDIIRTTSRIGLIDLFKIKPINEISLLNILDKYNKIITIEENSLIGGIGSIIIEIINDNNLNINVKRIAIPDEQTFHYGDRYWLRKLYKIDSINLQKIIHSYM